MFLATFGASSRPSAFIPLLRDTYHMILDDLDDDKELTFALMQTACARQFRRRPDRDRVERRPETWRSDRAPPRTSPAKSDIKYLRQGAHGPEPYNKYTRQGAQTGVPLPIFATTSITMVSSLRRFSKGPASQSPTGTTLHLSTHSTRPLHNSGPARFAVAVMPTPIPTLMPMPPAGGSDPNHQGIWNPPRAGGWVAMTFHRQSNAPRERGLFIERTTPQAPTKPNTRKPARLAIV
jgi:hypothetical protein